MDFYEALEIMKRGDTVEHAGKRYALRHRGIHDVTDLEKPERVQLTQEAWAAMAPPPANEEPPPEVVAPEAVDSILHD